MYSISFEYYIPALFIRSGESVMNSNNESIQRLKNQIKGLNFQIELLALKKNEAERMAKQYGQELETLYAAHRAASQQLHGLEADTCNMWENIGEGG
jgi:chromosome segregation ATPase